MSVAVIGCIPTQIWPPYSAGTAYADFPPEPGTIAQNGEQEYILIQAINGIAQYRGCTIERNFRADEWAGQENNRGFICVPQVAIPDEHWGWGLIKGHGLIIAVGAALVGANRTTANGMVNSTSGSQLGDFETTVKASSGGGATRFWCYRPFVDR